MTYLCINNLVLHTGVLPPGGMGELFTLRCSPKKQLNEVEYKYDNINNSD